MAQYAQVQDASQIVVNIITWDGNEDVASGGWAVPSGYTMVKVNDDDRIYPGVACGVGWTYNGDGTYSPPPSGPPPEVA